MKVLGSFWCVCVCVFFGRLIQESLKNLSKLMPFSTCKHVIIAVQNICIVAFGSGTGHLSVDYKFMIG